ncbi:MAG: peptide-methionine (R)-S-oxide reductase MsrB [Chitinophagales bacterium]
MKLKSLFLSLICSLAILFSGCQTNKSTSKTFKSDSIKQLNTQQNMENSSVQKTEEEWKAILTDEEYRVLREAGTEPAFTGKYTDLKADGNYYCKACGNLLFSSNTKFHSGCGWPSFFDNVGDSSVITRIDNSYGMTRIEVLCKKCHSHLGHVFPDGPKDKTGLRYCINSISLDFKPKEK